MLSYEEQIKTEVSKWKKEMRKGPGLLDKVSKDVQNKVNSILPSKYHEAMTSTIKHMTKAVLMGSEFTVTTPRIDISMKEREQLVSRLTSNYKAVAMFEGAGTGAGGIMLGLADFPLLLSIKIKFLYEMAAIYGFNTKDYKERIYILSIFELTFSSQAHVKDVFKRLEDWNNYKQTIPEDMKDFDWKTFQQEYRDYLDLAKFMQMMPIIGAPIGAYVNGKLMKKLSESAMQAYRMRWIHE